MYFWNYRLEKTWLDKCLKSPVWEDFWTRYMVNRPKDCWNLKDNTFAIFIDQCESNWVGKTLLVICQILGVFLNALNENDKYSVLNQDNLTQPIQIQLSRKEKKFSKFFPKFSKARLNLEHFQRNRWHSSSTSEMKLPKTIEIWMQHLYYLYWSSWRLLSWKKSLLVICKILGLFVNTLTADEKYSLLNRDNLMQPIQMQLS